MAEMRAGGDVDLAVRVVRQLREQQAHVQCRLAGVGHDTEHVVFALFRLLRQVLGTIDQRTGRVLVGRVALGILDRFTDVNSPDLRCAERQRSPACRP